MYRTPLPQPERLRLLEAWLPLGQTLNQEFGWHLEAEALEQLVLAAAPVLARVTTLADARAVLYYAYAQIHRGDP
jgi:hypothetical protein